MESIARSKKLLLSFSWGNTSSVTEETPTFGFSYVCWKRSFWNTWESKDQLRRILFTGTKLEYSMRLLVLRNVWLLPLKSIYILQNKTFSVCPSVCVWWPFKIRKYIFL